MANQEFEMFLLVLHSSEVCKELLSCKLWLTRLREQTKHARQLPYLLRSKSPWGRGLVITISFSARWCVRCNLGQSGMWKLRRDLLEEMTEAFSKFAFKKFSQTFLRDIYSRWTPLLNRHSAMVPATHKYY